MPDPIDPKAKRAVDETEQEERNQAIELRKGEKPPSANKQNVPSASTLFKALNKDKITQTPTATNHALEDKVSELEREVRNLKKKLKEAKHKANVLKRPSVRHSNQRGLFFPLPRNRGASFISSGMDFRGQSQRPSLSATSVSNFGIEEVLPNVTETSSKDSTSANSSPKTGMKQLTMERKRDPAVEKLLEEEGAKLTRTSLKELPITKPMEMNPKRAGFRMLMESKEENTVEIERVDEGVFHLPSVTKMQIKLKWVQEPRRVLVVKRPNDQAATHAMHQIIDYLGLNSIQCFMEAPVEADLDLTKIKIDKKLTPKFLQKSEIPRAEIDFIVCLGGDGTILWANGLFPTGIPPVLSFKMGSLGFLTLYPLASFSNTLERILKEDMEATIRSRLQVVVRRKNEEPVMFTCLNEVVAKHPSKMVSLDLFSGSNHLTVVHADGLIIATPTGSTAYSLACGGSMVHPAIPAIVITPIAPHTLSFRPIVLADSSTVRVKVRDEARSEVYLSFDGRDQYELRQGDEIEITVSEYPMAAYCMDSESKDWFGTIKESFLWNVRTDQKKL